MPLYVYDCPRCGAREEKVRSVAERDRAVWCSGRRADDVRHHEETKMKRVEFPGSNFTIEVDYV